LLRSSRLPDLAGADALLRLRKRSQLAQSTGVIHRRRQTRYMLGRLAAGKTSRLEIKLFNQ
jgi:hypothetical protein